MVLLGTSAVSYATGAAAPGADSSRAELFRPVAIVVRGDPAPHLFTPYPDGAPDELPADHLHDPLYPDVESGGVRVRDALTQLVDPRARVVVDEVTHPMAGVLGPFDLGAAGPLLGPAKVRKTSDELACIRIAQHINERAIADVQPMLRPGVVPSSLTAAFLRRIFDLGAHSVGIDPIWQVMPSSLAEGPWTSNGDVAFPAHDPDRVYRDGDVVWVDTSVHYQGYASDFGRTWIAARDPQPSPRQRSQFRQWLDVLDAALDECRPGATGGELCRAATAAAGGRRPWMDHLYLAHGIGTDLGEMPMIGTDLGEAFDDQLVLEPGMVLVFEPVIWDDGHAGYRSEEVTVVTDDGWASLSSYPFDPYEPVQ
jgi:Xaa-Pro aminopeptidase